MLLSSYLQNTRDLLHDANGNFYTDAQLTRWINRARRQVATDGQCVRILPPSTGSVSAITVAGGGSGYTTGTVTVAAPDSAGPGYTRALAAPTFSGGLLSSVAVNAQGTGYVAVPAVTVTGNGTGASALAVLTQHVTTIAGQEVYSIATIAGIIQSLYPGAGDILGIQGISISWGAQKPTLRRCDFSTMQAQLRAWQGGMQGPPSVWAQLGQGSTGSFYLWPVPVQVTRMDVDCYCTVVDLVGASVPDLIPEPWSEPAQYYAAMLAYQNAQRPDDARGMLSEYARTMGLARAAVSTAMVPSFYGDGQW